MRHKAPAAEYDRGNAVSRLQFSDGIDDDDGGAVHKQNGDSDRARKLAHTIAECLDDTENLALYADEVRAFLNRGGIIAWGVVPNSPKAKEETVESLVKRLHDGMNLLVHKGVKLDDLLRAALITPACGLETLTVEQAERILELTAGVTAANEAIPSDGGPKYSLAGTDCSNSG